MSRMKKDLLDFLSRGTPVPENLLRQTKRDIQLTFHKKSILTKFILYQTLGAFLTLSFCPQFGIGLVEGHGITHYFRMIGDWACATFCGSLFLSSGMLMAYIGMKGEELWWIWRNYRGRLIFMPALLWSTLMLGNITLDGSSESLIYHLSWLVSAILVQTLWFSFKSSYVQTKQI